MSTKQDLVDNFLLLVMKKGYDNVSLNDVSGAVGIKKASVFSHFKDYEELKSTAVSFCLSQLAESRFEINPRSESAQSLFVGLINSFIDVFTAFPVNALISSIEQKRTFDEAFARLSDQIDLMFSSRFQVALDYCVQRSWTDINDTDEVAKLFSVYLRNLISRQNLNDDDLSEMLQTFLHIL